MLIVLKLFAFLTDGKYLSGQECACLIHITISGICYSIILLSSASLEIMPNFACLLAFYVFVGCVCV